MGPVIGAAHHYQVTVRWTGNLGTGTADYRRYSRDHSVEADGPQPLAGSSDPTFRGDRSRWNPEQLLLAALSQCHMLSYLHVAVTQGIVVTDYVDQAEGTMRLNADGSGEFTSVTLRPQVTVQAESMLEAARSAHHDANRVCFIARSVNFPVLHEPSISTASAS